MLDNDAYNIPSYASTLFSPLWDKFRGKIVKFLQKVLETKKKCVYLYSQYDGIRHRSSKK